MGRVVLLTATLITAFAFVASALAADLPTPGTTTTIRCRFEPRSELLEPGITLCNIEILTITRSSCNEDGTRAFHFSDRFIAREYRGNVIRRGLNGVEVEGSLEDVVRPHARLIFEGSGLDSGQVNLPDPSCAV